MTFEFIFACPRYQHARQWGCALNAFDKPDVREGVLWCSKCGRGCLHVFVRVEQRGLDREREMEALVRKGQYLDGHKTL
jgi:hypothetical protein